VVARQLVVQFGKLAPGILGRLPVGRFLWPALGQTLEQLGLAVLAVRRGRRALDCLHILDRLVPYKTWETSGSLTVTRPSATSASW
jgi:hypothetical protein